MFILTAEKNRLTVSEGELLTSGSVNVYTVKFVCGVDWEGLTLTAVFRAGEKQVSVLLDKTGICTVPWEVLTVARHRLDVGLYGCTNDGKVVLPTIWANCGFIQPGTAAAPNARPPTPDLWRQELSRKGDTLEYDGENLSLMSGNETLSSVEIVGGGTSDHCMLANRDAENQHPITSITGLAEELDTIPAPIEPLTNIDLEELLK